MMERAAKLERAADLERVMESELARAAALVLTTKRLVAAWD